MKRTLFILFIILLVIQFCYADKYVIRAMNGQSIAIGERKRICCVDSIFDSTETIHWNNTVSVIEAQNVETKTYCYFVSKEARSKESGNSPNIIQRLFNYFTNMTHLSTREVSENNLEEALTGQEFHLVDYLTFVVSPPYDKRIYYASYYHNGIKHTLPLPVEDGKLVFKHGLFTKDGINLPHKFILTVFYIEEDFFHEITRGMILNVEPGDSQN